MLEWWFLYYVLRGDDRLSRFRVFYFSSSIGRRDVGNFLYFGFFVYVC